MRFIGQHHIMRQLRYLLPDLYENRRGANILLRGPSGYGKTTMALSICEYLAGKNFQFYLYDREPFNFRKWVIFVDEIHKMKDHELLYPEMDKKYHVLLFATNQDGNLPEAFSNRCWEYVFDDYSQEELLLIALESAGFYTPQENLLKVIEAGNRNPRVIKDLLGKLRVYFSQSREDSKSADFDKIIREVFSIEGGLDILCRKYLETLENVGGTASLTLMKNILHVDEGTLTNNVEPILLKKGLISISRKGRSLVYDN